MRRRGGKDSETEIELENYPPARTGRISWVSISRCHGRGIRQRGNPLNAQPNSLEQSSQTSLTWRLSASTCCRLKGDRAAENSKVFSVTFFPFSNCSSTVTKLKQHENLLTSNLYIPGGVRIPHHTVMEALTPHYILFSSSAAVCCHFRCSKKVSLFPCLSPPHCAQFLRVPRVGISMRVHNVLVLWQADTSSFVCITS